MGCRRLWGLFISLALVTSAALSAAQDCMSFCEQSPGEEGPGSCAALQSCRRPRHNTPVDPAHRILWRHRVRAEE